MSFSFLAYFHTLLSALFRPSVRLSVRPSVTATSLQGIDQFCSFMAQSIAYESGTCLKEGIFFGSVLELVGGVRSSILVFVFLECVDQMCGSNVWIKMCGLKCADQIYGSIVRIINKNKSVLFGISSKNHLKILIFNNVLIICFNCGFDNKNVEKKTTGGFS
jgi:hypothetical protein